MSSAYLSPAAEPAADALVAAWRRELDACLRTHAPRPQDPVDLVSAAVHETLLAPGKRLRPLLMLAVGHALRCPRRAWPALLQAACAVEMVHTASLVLDDMPCMDDATLRRGRPATHLRWGEDVAMLTVVALLTHACALLASLPQLTATTRARLVHVLCAAVGPQGLVRGQLRDLREGALQRTPQQVTHANELKTGVLFAAALEMSAVAAGTPTAVPALRRAACEIGQAFQLRDDLLDGDHQLQAPALKDRLQDIGKSTLVVMLGAAAARQRLHEHLRQAHDALEETLRAAAVDADSAGPLHVLLRQAFHMIEPAQTAVPAAVATPAQPQPQAASLRPREVVA